MICNKCHIDKSTGEFYKDKTHVDGLRKICKECDKKSSSKRYFDNWDKRRNQRREWGKNHPSASRIGSAMRFKGFYEKEISKTEILEIIALERLVKLKSAKKINSLKAKKLYKDILSNEGKELKITLSQIFNNKLIGG